LAKANESIPQGEAPVMPITIQFDSMQPHPEPHRSLQRRDKEALLGQRGIVVWLYGLSGAGKSSIANAAERVLHQQGRFTSILDGDHLRASLNANLGFSDQDCLENIRRIAETAGLLVNQGIITLVSAITPRGELRDLARGILGADLFEVYVKASDEACKQRDVKGLYAKAACGEIQHPAERDSAFEAPHKPDLILDTEHTTVEDATFELLEAIRDRITLS
jgi:adenylylsulfate kinase